MISVALLLAVAPAPDWREFDRFRNGWEETPSHYDLASVERQGARVRAWVRWTLFLSGLPDVVQHRRMEIDCARREARWLDASGGPDRVRQTRRARPSRFEPIAAGSMEAALSALVCR